MAQQNSSANKTPAWVTAMIKELKRLQQDVSVNRNLLNHLIELQRPSPNVERSTHHIHAPTPSVAGPSSRSASKHVSRHRQPVAGPSSNRPIPVHHEPPKCSNQRKLVTQIANNPEILRPCWYHRQFGAASATCIEPCSFTPSVMQHHNGAVQKPKQLAIPAPMAIPPPAAPLTPVIQSCVPVTQSGIPDIQRQEETPVVLSSIAVRPERSLSSSSSSSSSSESEDWNRIK